MSPHPLNFLQGWDAEQVAAETKGEFMAAFVRATKPAAVPTATRAGPCCPSGCCP